MASHLEPKLPAASTTAVRAWSLWLMHLTLLAASASASAGPNVLLFMPDDMPFMWGEGPAAPASDSTAVDWSRYSSLAPHMSSIRRDGCTFTAAHTTGPKCAPSRFGLMTGRFPSRGEYARQNARSSTTSRTFVNVPQTKLDGGDLAETLPAALRGAGVATIHAGKWHLAPEARVNLWDDYRSTAALVGGAGFARPAAVYASNMNAEYPGGFSHNNEWMVAESLAGVDAALTAEQGFFLYFAGTGPHSPNNERALEQFELTDTPAGALDAEPVSGMPARATVSARAPASAAVRDTLIGVIGADDALGALLAGLDARTALDDTLVIVTMDHGTIAKDALYQGGTRVALMMRYPPAIPAGRVVTTPVTNLDIAPTVLELLGAAAAGELDGTSLWAAVTGATAGAAELEARQCLVAEIDLARSVTCGRHKLISNWAAEPSRHYPAAAAEVQMYDLAADPTEQTNLATDPGSARVLAALARYLACHDADTTSAVDSAPCNPSRLSPLDAACTDSDLELYTAAARTRFAARRDAIAEHTGVDAVECAARCVAAVVDEGTACAGFAHMARSQRCVLMPEGAGTRAGGGAWSYYSYSGCASVGSRRQTRAVAAEIAIRGRRL